MGFFSWRTQDTDRSIANNYSTRKTFTVVMIDNKGNKWVEQSYEGYGVFGGKDFYELLAEMNGFVSEKGLTYEIDSEAYTDEARGFGISLAFKDNGSGIATKGVLYPNLIEQAEGWVYNESGPDNCEYQGYFYDETDYDDEESDDEDNY
jgi:hypothetical protein